MNKFKLNPQVLRSVDAEESPKVQKIKSEKFVRSVVFRLAVSPRQTAQLHMHRQHSGRVVVPLGERVETHLGHWFSMYPRSSNGLHEQRRIRPGWLGHRSPRTVKTYWHSFSPHSAGSLLHGSVHLTLGTPLRHYILLSLHCLYLYIPPLTPLISESTYSHTQTCTPLHVLTENNSTWTKNPVPPGSVRSNPKEPLKRFDFHLLRSFLTRSQVPLAPRAHLGSAFREPACNWGHKSRSWMNDGL